MPRKTISRLAAITLLMCAPALVAASVNHVWALNDGEKVERDDPAHKGRKFNSAWDGRRVRIFGGRNEIIAFQLIVEADKDGIESLTVALPALKQKGGGEIVYTPPSNDPTDYSGRPVQIFPSTT